uniref:Retrotransposon protein, putative, unclassified n=1 Tax=Oryza sativa subsp. japonica TaxID=39947 RepID=Q33AV0_ORYSJ|nr:retrotransposon protein, putative, unclassified [Oryza sativa Japonica Group]
MVFTLPAEFGIDQTDVDEVEEESIKPEQAVFEKPEGTENRHLKPLYINGYVNGKPMSKMMVDGGAAINLMPYAMFRKLGRNAEDLIKTNMVLKDFGGNPSETKGVLNVELTVGMARRQDRDRASRQMENPSYYFEGVVEGSNVYTKDTVDDLDDKVRPHQQPPRRCKADMLEPVKAEIKRLYDAGFIRPCRYAEWVSSIVPVIKKKGKVRSKEIEDHIADLRKVFERTRKYNLKMNPTKCAFGVSAGQFLGFLVHERGIEVTQRSVNAIKKIQPPENKTELQEMIGKITFVRRFISNLSGRLRHYLLSNECTVICKADVVKYMLSALILKGRVGKYIFSLTEFDLRYESPKAIKGQAIADFIVEHRDDSIGSVEILPWTLFFDGSVCTHGCGIGLVIISPRGACFEFAYTIKPYATNNQAEYEAVLKGLELLKEVEADAIEIMGDSLIVISQLAGEYECKNDTLMVYNEKCQELMKEFRLVTLKHVSR